MNSKRLSIEEILHKRDVSKTSGLLMEELERILTVLDQAKTKSE